MGLAAGAQHRQKRNYVEAASIGLTPQLLPLSGWHQSSLPFPLRFLSSQHFDN